MEALSQQMTVLKGQTLKGLFTFNNTAVNNGLGDSVTNSLDDNVSTTPAGITIIGTSDSTTGVWCPWNPYGSGTAAAPWYPNPYPTTIPTTITPIPTSIPFPTGVPATEPFVEPYDVQLIDPTQFNEGLVKRLEELLDRAKKQQAAAAPEKQIETQEASPDDEADIDTARFKQIEPKRDVP